MHKSIQVFMDGINAWRSKIHIIVAKYYHDLIKNNYKDTSLPKIIKDGDKIRSQSTKEDVISNVIISPFSTENDVLNVMIYQDPNNINAEHDAYIYETEFGVGPFLKAKMHMRDSDHLKTILRNDIPYKDIKVKE